MSNIRPSWNNIIFLVSAPSGAGKTTLCDKLRTEFKDIHYAITATTRAPRGEELNGKDYYFLTMSEFEERLAAGGFIESALVHGNRYGSPRPPSRPPSPKAATSSSTSTSRAPPPSASTSPTPPPATSSSARSSTSSSSRPPPRSLRARLVKRGTDSIETIEKRLRQAREEISHWNQYKYMVVNDNLAEAYDHMRAIILAERHRIENRREPYHG